tara:strand:- start:633 stop:1382 length:750 start_codon:yes stop_codon:yes gene_type:complete
MSIGQDEVVPQTTTVNPPAYAAPFLAYGANEAQRLYNTGGGFNYFPDNTLAGFSPEQQMAMTLQTNRALSGSPLTREAQDLSLNTLRGDFLSGNNPFFQQAVIDPITQDVQSYFSRAGRLGSGANQDVLTRSLATPLMQNFENERRRQNAMIGTAPSLARADLQDYADLARVGAMRQDQAQRQIAANMDRFNFLQSAPARNLNQFLGQVGTAAGGYKSQTSPYVTNPLNQTLSTIGNVIGGIDLVRGLF